MLQLKNDQYMRSHTITCAAFIITLMVHGSILYEDDIFPMVHSILYINYVYPWLTKVMPEHNQAKQRAKTDSFSSIFLQYTKHS